MHDKYNMLTTNDTSNANYFNDYINGASLTGVRLYTLYKILYADSYAGRYLTETKAAQTYDDGGSFGNLFGLSDYDRCFYCYGLLFEAIDGATDAYPQAYLDKLQFNIYYSTQLVNKTLFRQLQDLKGAHIQTLHNRNPQ
jgi:hypothetical protein